MKRITINALVDIGCLITFMPSLVSGLVLISYFRNMLVESPARIPHK